MENNILHALRDPRDYFSTKWSLSAKTLKSSLAQCVGFDLETTGLNPASAQITQIGAISLDDPSIVFNSLNNGKVQLTPENRIKLVNEACDSFSQDSDSLSWVLAYNNYHPLVQFLRDDNGNFLKCVGLGGREYNLPGKPTKEQALDVINDTSHLLTEEEALGCFQDWLLTIETKSLLGHNIINFDVPFLASRQRVYGLPSVRFPYIDTMWFARGVFLPVIHILAQAGDDFAKNMVAQLLPKKEGSPLQSSLQSIRKCGMIVKTAGEAHNAIGDVLTTVGVLEAMNSYLIEVSGKFLENEHLLASLQDHLDFLRNYYEDRNWGY